MRNTTKITSFISRIWFGRSNRSTRLVVYKSGYLNWISLLHFRHNVTKWSMKWNQLPQKDACLSSKRSCQLSRILVSSMKVGNNRRRNHFWSKKMKSWVCRFGRSLEIELHLRKWIPRKHVLSIKKKKCLLIENACLKQRVLKNRLLKHLRKSKRRHRDRLRVLRSEGKSNMRKHCDCEISCNEISRFRVWIRKKSREEWAWKETGRARISLEVSWNPLELRIKKMLWCRYRISSMRRRRWNERRYKKRKIKRIIPVMFAINGSEKERERGRLK